MMMTFIVNCQVCADPAVDNQVDASLGEQVNHMTLGDNDYDTNVDAQGGASGGYELDALVNVMTQDLDLADGRIDRDRLTYDHSDPTAENLDDQGQSKGTLLPAVLFHAADGDDDEDDRKPPFIVPSPVDSSSADNNDSKQPADIT